MARPLEQETKEIRIDITWEPEYDAHPIKQKYFALARETLLRNGCHDIEIIEDEFGAVAKGMQGEGARYLLRELAKAGDELYEATMGVAS